MIGFWTAYKTLSGTKSMLVNAGLVAAILAAVWGAYKLQIWRAEKRGASNAIEQIKKDNDAANSAANSEADRFDACMRKGDGWRWKIGKTGEPGTCERL